MKNQLTFYILLLVSFCGTTKTIAQTTCPPPVISYTINCGDDSVQLNASAGYTTYSWTPVTGLSDPLISNPMVAVGSGVTYTLTTTTTTGSTTNLVYNGDFALGNTGFTTILNFTSLYSPGNYYVAPTFFTTAYSTGDHTPTADQMFMSVDGAYTVGALWEQTIPTISPSTNYQFSFWGTDGGTINPPIYEMHLIGNVTGDVIVSTQTAYPGTGTWNWGQYSAPLWNSGTNTSVILRVVNLETNGYGNDFGLDDFSFTTTSCTSSTTVTVNNINLTANFNADTACAGTSTHFADLSSGGVTSWAWSFGDGTASSLQNPDHFYGISGNYTVTLVVGNTLGCSDTVAQSIMVYQQPNASFTMNVVCAGGATAFTNTSTTLDGSIVSVWWNFGDGTTAVDYNPNHVLGGGVNSYTTSLVVLTSYGCIDTVNQIVTTNPSPIAGFSATVGESFTIQFTDVSSGATSWSWDLDDGSTSVLENPIHTYSEGGNQLVTQIVFNNLGCSDTLTQAIVIVPETTVFIPNAFTPSSSSINNIFAPKLYGVIEFSMLIFDRWGNELFKTTDMDEGWNGRYKGLGEMVQQGVYVYKIFVKDSLRNDHSYIGSVTVVR